MLSERLRRGTFTTEDSVRFTFYASMLEKKVDPADVIMEYPHPKLAQKKIDTWISPQKERKGLATEFKYNRASRRNQARPLNAGRALHDLHRMNLLGADMHRIFVYLTDDEMAAYFNNTRNGLSEFFGTSVGGTAVVGRTQMQNLSTTLIEAANLDTDIKIQTLCNVHLHSDHHLRVWKIV